MPAQKPAKPAPHVTTPRAKTGAGIVNHNGFHPGSMQPALGEWREQGKQRAERGVRKF